MDVFEGAAMMLYISFQFMDSGRSCIKLYSRFPKTKNDLV